MPTGVSNSSRLANLLIGASLVFLTFAGCQTQPIPSPASSRVDPEPSEIVQNGEGGVRLFATPSATPSTEAVQPEEMVVASESPESLESTPVPEVLPTEAELADAEAAVVQPPPETTNSATLPLIQGPKPGPLSLEAAIELALTSSDAVKLMEADLAIATAGRLAAHDHRDPELGLRYNQGDGEQAATSWDFDNGLAQVGTTPQSLVDAMADRSVMATQIVDSSIDSGTAMSASLAIFPQNPIERKHRIAAAKSNEKAVREELSHIRWETRMEVARLYSEVEYLHRDLHMLTKLVAIYRQAVRDTEMRVEAGEGTPEDTMAASRRYLGALSERSAFVQKFLMMRDELSSLVGVPGRDLQILALPKSFAAVDPETLPVDDLIQSAMENRADLEALAYHTAAAKSAYREVCGTRMPWFTSIEGMYTVAEGEESDYLGNNEFLLDPHTISSESTSEESEWRISASINIPIFSWFNKTPSLFRAEYRKAELEEVLASENVEKDVQNAVAVLKDLASYREKYDTTTAPVIRDMNRMLEQLSDADLTPEEVARIREQVIESERQQLRFERDFRQAVINLERLIGLPLK